MIPLEIEQNFSYFYITEKIFLCVKFKCTDIVLHRNLK